MKKFILPVLAIIYASSGFSQNVFKALVKDSLSNESLIGSIALLKGTTNGISADTEGKIEIKNIPNGSQTIVFSIMGYKTQERIYSFPLKEGVKERVILMKPLEEELEEVIISSTRTSRNIQNVPTRVETIELEELDEKTNMRPANVSMILHESTGIQVQQTSATNGNSSIRIQGLDGRYTQLLKDGYPNFGNFAGGLSILEIPPLDLQQVEIIKGPASTLFGGGAIAGVVNFISKKPKEKFENNIILNQSHLGQSNIGLFSSHKKNRWGYTFLALGNFQKPYDVDKDDFTELPKSEDWTFHPKIFFYATENASFSIDNSFTQGNRLGGDIQFIKGNNNSNHNYFEKNTSLRNNTSFEYDQKLKNTDHLNIKSGLSHFSREIELPNYNFKGKNTNSFSDVSYVHNLQNQTLIMGANFIYDQFIETDTIRFTDKDFNSNTTGLYVQHTWDVNKWLKLESGLRYDIVHYSNLYYAKTENFLLPRISSLFNFNEKVSSRIGAGLGYKAPTIFTEQTELFQYRNILALKNVFSEKSYGGTADLNYKTNIGEDLFFAINQMFYYTEILNSTLLLKDFQGNYYFANTGKLVYSSGFETNMKFIFKEHIKLFVGYTYSVAKAKYLSPNPNLFLLPKNKLNLALVYEKEGHIKAGFEAYYTGQQYLPTGKLSSPFWDLGFMLEKIFEKVSFYINAENMLDTRQSRYKRVVNEPHNNPSFNDIWTHTEGLALSVGFKLKL